MKSPILQAINSGSVSRQALMVVALTAMIGVLSVSPAFADDGHDQRGNHGRRDHYGDRRQHDRHGDRRDYEYRRYNYAQPVYAPPVYYEPRQSSGISLFFPMDFRR